MSDRIWKCRIAGGEIIQKNKNAFRRLLKKLDGKACDLILREQQTPKHDSLRRHYFGYVIKPLADYTGHASSTLHEFFKMEFASETDEHGLKIVKSVFSNNSSLTDNERIRFIYEVCSRIKLIDEQIDVKPYGV